MMRRYARKLASVGIGSEMVDVWLVIRTDEVPPTEVLAAGFELVPADLTDTEVCARYGVAEIRDVVNDLPLN